MQRQTTSSPSRAGNVSALTIEVKDAKSPVAQWLRSTFPHHHEVRANYREAAEPDEGVG
ncbi:hypothetical protein [Micromonospora sp. WMMC250]|uniref:hypothetical protein n=1 Tax=Micromonospora sp. WMMC250 TaxID=3014781 RepID=UPI0022B70A7A|nr:hypothetical protein [Micromonospora sp. WMMC250]MCZ7374889.1 hypothetical protein [Micromonospora sp. WMMC250]